MNNLPCLLAVTLFFYIVGGVVDYWQSAKEHGKNLPSLINNYFALFWLVLYSGILPFCLVYAASDFNLKTGLSFSAFALFGMVLWDLVYSKLDQNTFVSNQKDYFYWGNKYFALSREQVLFWHFIRIGAATLMLIFLKSIW